MSFQFYATFDAHGLARYIPPNIPIMLPASSWYPDGMHAPPIPAQISEAAADCGGYIASRIWGDYRYTLEQYIDWLTSWPVAPTWAAMMDYCCEPDLHHCTRDRQDRTTANAISAWSQYRAVPWTWTPTIQGLDPEDYSRHASELAPLIGEMQRFYAEQGKANTFRVGIGTLCRRTNTMATSRVIDAVRAALPQVETFHLWGIKLSIIRAINVPALPGSLSCDSATWHGKMYNENTIRDQAAAADMSIRRYCITVMLPHYAEQMQAAAATRTMLAPEERSQHMSQITEALAPYGLTIHIRRRRNREFLYADAAAIPGRSRHTLYIGPLNTPLDVVRARILEVAGAMSQNYTHPQLPTTKIYADRIAPALSHKSEKENTMPYLNIEAIFTYHPPTGTQATRYEEIRNNARKLALLIQQLTPESAEQTLAIRKLQEATMFANAAIAINEATTPDITEHHKGIPHH